MVETLVVKMLAEVASCHRGIAASLFVPALDPNSLQHVNRDFLQAHILFVESVAVQGTDVRIALGALLVARLAQDMQAGKTGGRRAYETAGVA